MLVTQAVKSALSGIKKRFTFDDESKKFYKMVFSLVFPIALQNLINVAVTSADVIMLGKVSEDAISGASLAGQVQFVMMLVFFGITSGASVLTAQYWGKRDIRTIEKVLGIALRFSLLIAAVFTAAAWIFPEQLLRIFTPEQAVIEQGVIYLKIVSCTYLLVSFTVICLNILRSVERVIISTVVHFVSLIINVFLNATFIFGLFGAPKLGIAGVAIATLTARAVELIIVVVYMLRNKVVKFRPRDLFVQDKQLFRDYLKYSMPVIINELIWGAATSMHSVIIGRLGSAAVAANSVAQVARQLAMVIAFGIANATAIVLGKMIGENKYEKAEDYARRFIRMTLIFAVMGAGVILLVSPIVRANMDLSETAKSYLTAMMFVMSYFCIAQAFNTTLVVGVFRAGGDTKFGLYLEIGTMWLGSIWMGAVAAFVLKLSVPWVYVILMSDELIKIPITIWRYRKKKWLNNVTR